MTLSKQESMIMSTVIVTQKWQTTNRESVTLECTIKINDNYIHALSKLCALPSQPLMGSLVPSSLPGLTD